MGIEVLYKVDFLFVYACLIVWFEESRLKVKCSDFLISFLLVIQVFWIKI